MSVSNDEDLVALSLNDREIELRKQWLQLGEEEEKIIREQLDPVISDHVDDLMDEMYRHFLKFEDTRSFFPNEHVLNHAKAAQNQYFRRLTKGDYDADYVSDRLHIGTTHHRIELDPKWYLGAYNHALVFLFPTIVKQYGADSQGLSQALSAFSKVIFFDMTLAIERYISAKEASIRKHRDAISDLETERRVTKSILESAPIGIVSLNNDFNCVECNEEFIEILPSAIRTEVIGTSLFEIIPGLNRALFEEVIKSGQPCRRIADAVPLSGQDTTYWDWAIWPVKDDASKITSLVAMFANVTDRVLLQQQREDFVATLTHDLKTPVLATNRAIQFLLDGDFGDVSSAQKEILETVLQSNTSLYSLVQTLLDVYRFDSGVKELKITRCNLAAMIMQMVTEIMPLAQEKGVALTATVPGDADDVSCDEAEIRRVLQNFIDNSLKFTPTGGSITVNMNQSDKETVISVADTGKGIPDENLPKLFQRFWQAGSTGRYYASTGLGLYLSRRIIEAPGGKIWCESSVGRGSTFHFSIKSFNEDAC
jgi:signal transduction histidine kinase